MWFMFVVVAMVVVLVIITSLFPDRGNPSRLDLSSVSKAMVSRHKWSKERAEAARDEYIRFLTLLQKNPQTTIVPWLDKDGRDDLDQFWHQHILDTVKYHADCKLLFGKYIHHNPHLTRGSVVEKAAATKTEKLYVRTFRSGTYGSAPNPDYLSSCATVVTDSSCDSHSHSHSDSSGHGDGGSHGGHSCSSHSCGGHSCGHGCGGH